MIIGKASPLFAAAVCLAGGAALAMDFTADAASDMQVTAIDCELHPRKVAIQNKGDTAQDLTGWILLSNKPYQFDKPYSDEAYELSGPDRPGQIGPGEIFYVFNGHLSEPAPFQSGGSWIYPWNYTPVLDESKFVLRPDGTDFIRLVDTTGFPWREVSSMRCPDNPGPIPPFQQPSTPTPAPSNPDPGAGGNTSQTDGNQATSAQTDGTQGPSQNVPAANAAAGSGTANTAQTGNVSAAAGAPESGAGSLRLQVSGGQRLSGPLLPLGVLGLLAAAALALVGVGIMRSALRRP